MTRGQRQHVQGDGQFALVPCLLVIEAGDEVQRRLPGRVARGGVCRQPVALVDLPPTFFAMAGVRLPWTMHGHDLQPLLKGR